MIERYSDHAANERTFLAWVRTGIATIAFGCLFRLFLKPERQMVRPGFTWSASRGLSATMMASRWLSSGWQSSSCRYFVSCGRVEWSKISKCTPCWHQGRARARGRARVDRDVDDGLFRTV